MDRNFKFFLYLLLLSPVIAYFVNLAGVSEYRYFFRPIFWMVCLFWYMGLKHKPVVPGYLIYLLLYILYKFCWDFYNYYHKSYEVMALFRKPHIEILLLFIMIENTKFDEAFISNSIRIIRVTFFAALGTTFIQLFVNPEFFYNPSVDDAEVTSIYQIRRQSIFSYIDDNSLGFDFLPLFAVYLGYCYYLKGRAEMLIVIIGIIVSFSSNTRYVMVGCVLVLMQFLVYAKFKLSKILKYAVGGGLAVASLVYFLKYAGYDFDAYVVERLFPEQDVTKSTRYFAYEIFNQFFYRNMWFGTGEHLTKEIEAALQGYSSQIHVGYLSHLVSYGIIGSFFLFMFWFSVLKMLFKKAKLSGYYGSLFAFLVFLWANATLVYYSVFTYGLIIAFVFAKYFGDRKDISAKPA